MYKVLRPIKVDNQWVSEGTLIDVSSWGYAAVVANVNLDFIRKATEEEIDIATAPDEEN